MFFYYGGKRAMARRYDSPTLKTIIEPFAGSAAYSMYHLLAVERILLYEKDARVVETWHRLLGMTPQEVAAIRVPEEGERTEDFLYMTTATSNAIANAKRMKVTDRMPDIIRLMLPRIARALPDVKRKVTVVHGDYREAPDIEATWFIDPPYQVVPGTSSDKTWFPQGMGYAKGCKATDLDYAELAEWCRSRRGQVIVCEQRGADWLPFRPLPGTYDSVARPLREVVWTNPGYGQQLLFGG